MSETEFFVCRFPEILFGIFKRDNTWFKNLWIDCDFDPLSKAIFVLWTFFIDVKDSVMPDMIAKSCLILPLLELTLWWEWVMMWYLILEIMCIVISRHYPIITVFNLDLLGKWFSVLFCSENFLFQYLWFL